MMSYALRRLPLFALFGAILCALYAPGLRPALAQSGYVSITTDKTQYQIGDSVRICYTVGGAGPFTITDLQPGGVSHTLYSLVDDGTGGCLGGTITPPAGRECYRLTAVGGSSQTCFQVSNQSGSPGPCIQIYPAPPGCGGTITTDQTQYNVGDTVRICYTVPGPGPVTITDTLANGASHTLLSGNDDGTGGCISGTVTPPPGTECLQLVSQSSGGTPANTCFQVLGQGGPIPAGQ